MGIPISDEQFLGFFRNLFRTARSYLVKRLASKRSRMIAAGALAAVVLALGIATRPQVSEVTLQGLILEIEAENILSEESGLPHTRVLIAVGDSTETQLLLPPPVPEIGHFVPLREGYTWNGDVKYTLDQEKWRLHGPS